jgi:hypothetical protein
MNSRAPAEITGWESRRKQMNSQRRPSGLLGFLREESWLSEWPDCSSVASRNNRLVALIAEGAATSLPPSQCPVERDAGLRR